MLEVLVSRVSCASLLSDDATTSLAAFPVALSSEAAFLLPDFFVFALVDFLLGSWGLRQRDLTFRLKNTIVFVG